MKFTEFTITTTTEAQELVADIMWQYTSYGVAISDVKDVVELINERKSTWDYLDDEVLKELELWYPTLSDGSFLEESKKRSLLLGKEILVLDESVPGGAYPAKAVDINELGNLVIERGGKIQVLNSGEVSIRL